MSLIFKGLVWTTLVACGFYGLLLVEGDRLIVQSLVRAADGTGRRTDVLGPSERPLPASPSMALSVRANGSGGDASAGGSTRIEAFASGHTRIAQMPTGTTGSSAPVAGAPPSPPPQKAPADDARRRLASGIQIELKRVGCYAGEIDGDWSQASQRAMKAFNERVKATLPITQPDYILLTLLQGHLTTACGAICPMGEADAGDGSCRPRAVVAESRLRAQSTEPAPWAQSLAQIVGGDKGAQPAATPPEADAQRARLAAEHDRLRQKAEAEARLQASARQAAEARTKAETARVEAAALAQRKADADKALADAERARIAAAEERRRQQAAEVEARTEAERLARVAEAEKARIAAEASRHKELHALAARAATAPRPAPVPQAPNETERAATARSDRDPETRRNAASANGNDGKTAQAAAPRFVGRFVPPPTYRVGRLPPGPVVIVRQAQRPLTRVYVSAPPSRPGGVFNHLSRHSP